MFNVYSNAAKRYEDQCPLVKQEAYFTLGLFKILIHFSCHSERTE